MKTDLGNDVVQRYQRDGFVYIPSFLSQDEVAELKSGVLVAIESMGKKKVTSAEVDLVEGDSHYDRVFTQRLNLWRISPVVKKYMLNPELGKLLCRLTGELGIRCWHDQALIKEPFGNPTAWHLDNPYWSFSSRNSITIWIALEDATLHNGCMWFVPTTQNLATWDNVPIGENMGDLFRIYPEMAKIDPVPVPMKAGDCSFHNGLTAHGAGANMTRGRRIAMTCAYMPEGSTYNGKTNILPPSYYKTLKPGDVLANDDWNPILYSQSSTRNLADTGR